MIDAIFGIAILIMSVVIHEVAHGYSAELLGDPTARLAGRLTLNPVKHLDFMGSIVIPILTSLGGFTFGWAKPVPYNPYNLKNQRWGSVLVALAGPLSNLVLAIFFGVLVRIATSGVWPVSFVNISATIVLINLVLAVFNLTPIPPLDGSRILRELLPFRFRYIMDYLERYALLWVLIFVFFLWQFMSPIIYLLFSALTGL